MKIQELTAGFVFDADESLKKHFPTIERWKLLRPAASRFNFGDRIVNNDFGNYWWATPEDGQDIEMLVCRTSILNLLNPKDESL